MANKSESAAESAVRGRILCVTSNFPRWRGDSTTPFVLNLAKDLQALGWQVDVLAPHAEKDTAAEEFIEGVYVRRFNYLWPRRLQTVCYHGGALVNLRANPLNAIKLPAFVFFQWLTVLLRAMSGRYSLLHSHWILPQGFTVAIAAKLLGIPHVVTVHGGDVFALKGGFLNRFKRFSLRMADVVTVNSSVTKAAVEEIAPALVNLQTIPMGVDIAAVSKDDPSVLAIRAQYGEEGGPLLVFLGRVVEEKGVGDFISSIAMLREDYPDAVALIIGEGQHRGHFEALAHSMGLERQVRFVGWIDSGEVPVYLAAADVFVGPSRRASDGWVEAQGLTFLEAMVAKTPVVATRSGGIVDSVEHGVTGLLVDESSPTQIAVAIRRIVDTPELGARLAENAHKLVTANFSRSSSADDFSRAFESLCRSSR